MFGLCNCIPLSETCVVFACLHICIYTFLKGRWGKSQSDDAFSVLNYHSFNGYKLNTNTTPPYCMSPSALSYGNVDKCRKVISTHAKRAEFLNAYEK